METLHLDYFTEETRLRWKQKLDAAFGIENKSISYWRKSKSAMLICQFDSWYWNLNENFALRIEIMTNQTKNNNEIVLYVSEMRENYFKQTVGVFSCIQRILLCIILESCTPK